MPENVRDRLQAAVVATAKLISPDRTLREEQEDLEAAEADLEAYLATVRTEGVGDSPSGENLTHIRRG